MVFPIGVIASDLTGAMDTAAAFVDSAGDALVLLGPGSPFTAPITAVVTDSAADRPEHAYEKVKNAAGLLHGRVLFKKIDSTMRGNIGPELTALIDEVRPEKVIVCPALPREGRTVASGVALVGGVPAHLTEYGRHPITPCRNADIGAVLTEQGHPVATIGLDDVRLGAEHLAEIVAASPSKAIVVDASSDDDVRVIARACTASAERWLPCGSSGLARAFAEALNGRPERADVWLEPSTAPIHGPILAIAGSRNQATITQLEALRSEKGCFILDVGAEALCQCPHGSENAGYVDLSAAALQRGESVVITTSLSPYVQHLSQQVAGRLGEMAREVVHRGKPGSIVLAGGATAWAVCRCLDATALRIEAELEPGVVSARLIDGCLSGVPVVTKAGGFGNRGTLVRVMSMGRPGQP
jgi:uncharacterized protein YgbK (DUF1537 family)